MAGTLRNIPMTVIASWPTPNFVDPVRRQWLVPYASTLQAVSTLFVGLRIYMRATSQNGAFGIDDVVLIVAFLIAALFSGVGMWLNLYSGIGTHLWDLTVPHYEQLALLLWVSEMAYILCSTCIKCSVLLLHRRVIDGTGSRGWKYAILGALVFTICTGVTFLATMCAGCHPLDAYWKVYGLNYSTDYKCINLQIPELVKGVLTVFGDLYSVVLPIGMLRSLNTSRHAKIALNAILCLGLTVVGAGAVRTYYTYKLGVDHDSSWMGFDLFVWADLEIQLGLICASTPALRSFYRKHLSHLPKLVSSAFSSSSSRSVNSMSVPVKSADPEGIEMHMDDKEFAKYHSSRVRVTSIDSQEVV